MLYKSSFFFFSFSYVTPRVPHGLSDQRVRMTKSGGLKGLQLEVGAR